MPCLRKAGCTFVESNILMVAIGVCYRVVQGWGIGVDNFTKARSESRGSRMCKMLAPRFDDTMSRIFALGRERTAAGAGGIPSRFSGKGVGEGTAFGLRGRFTVWVRMILRHARSALEVRA